MGLGLVQILKPMLEYHGVSAYLSGHDHCEEHIDEGKGVQYHVIGAANQNQGSHKNKDKVPASQVKFLDTGSLPIISEVQGGFASLSFTDDGMVVKHFRTSPTGYKLMYTADPVLPRRSTLSRSSSCSVALGRLCPLLATKACLQCAKINEAELASSCTATDVAVTCGQPNVFGCSDVTAAGCKTCFDHTVVFEKVCVWCLTDSECHDVGSLEDPCSNDKCISDAVKTTCTDHDPSTCPS